MNGFLFVNAALASWNLGLRRADATLSAFTDEQFYRQIAPGKNRVLYLVGHLTAVHDAMIPLLGIGDRLHPELDEPFIKQPDRAVEDVPAPGKLRQYWTEVNTALNAGLLTLTPAEWLQRHNAVTDEEYAKDPTRNRLAVLLNRTNHLSYHNGQIVLAK